MGQAAGGEILVTDVVRQLVEGKEYEFSQRGEADLKGLRRDRAAVRGAVGGRRA
jgi:class 3 adenylate cyclase